MSFFFPLCEMAFLAVVAVLGLPSHTLRKSMSDVVAISKLLLSTLWDDSSAVMAMLGLPSHSL